MNQKKIESLRARKEFLWDIYGEDSPSEWPEEARRELAEIDEALLVDWEKRYLRREARRAKRLASGGVWHE